MHKEVCYYCEGSGYLMRTPKKSRKSLIKCSVCDGTAIEGITLEEFGDRLKLVGAFYSGKIEDAKREVAERVGIKIGGAISLLFTNHRSACMQHLMRLRQTLNQKHLKEQSNDKPTTPPENEWVDEREVLG